MLRSPPIWCSKQIKTLHDSLSFDPDLCGSASSTNNLHVISSDRKLNYPTLEKDHGEVTGGFLRRGDGRCPTLAAWKGRKNLRWCCCIWMCASEILRPSLSHFACVQSGITPSPFPSPPHRWLSSCSWIRALEQVKSSLVWAFGASVRPACVTQVENVLFVHRGWP